MTPHDLNPPFGPAAPRRFLPVLLVLFVGSGCAALIYEVIWLQFLQLVIGLTAVCLGVLLGTFMGGMCLGSLLLPRLVSGRRHPLRVYALLELGIGVIGLLVLFGMPYVEHIYTHYAGHGAPGILLRGAVAGVCLLPPTLLMGATLPAIARWVETGPEGVSWLGFFYGGNIAGAVFGCLLAGFYLLRVHDMATATYVAFALNVTVAAIALALAAAPARYEATADPRAIGSAVRTAGAWAVYLAIALSGMSALGAEVVWTRLLSLVLGGTVYTFSLILAVFLIGLGLGSSLGAFLARRAAAAQVALGACQWFLTAAIAWTAVMISESLPYWPIVPGLSPSPWYTFQFDLVRCLWAVLPPACLWGASFPLALAAVAARGQDPGRLVGGVYAANTIGAIAGALLFSLLLVPAIGTAGSERVLIGLAAAAALVALLPLLRPAPRGVRLGGAAALAAAMGVAGWLAWSVTPVPWVLVAYGRETASYLTQSAPGILTDVLDGPDDLDVFCTYVGEGTNVSVAVTMTREGVRSFHAAGRIQASTLPNDMRVQRMLGHIPALVHKKPESVLVVACGAGVTAGTFLLHPDVKRIVICDIEPLVPTIVTPMFGKENHHVVDGIARENPHTVNGKQVEVVYDDGRHFLRTTPGEVRHHHLRPDRPVGQGVRRTEYGGILPDVPRSPESGREHEPLDPSPREQPGHGQVRDRHLLPGLPPRHPVDQRARGPRLPTRPVRPGRADGDRRRRTASAAGPSGPSAREAVASRGGVRGDQGDQDGGGRGIGRGDRLARHLLWAGALYEGVVAQAPRSTPTATCGSNTWPACG